MNDGAAVVGVVVTAILVFVAIGAVIMLIPQWRIFTRAGYPGALALLMLLPLVNLVVLLWFAFADWPALRQARAEAEPRRFGR